MKLINHGKWEPYVSDLEIHLSIGAATLKNADGIDYLEYRKTAFQKDSLLMCVSDDGIVREASNQTFPVVPDGNTTLYEIQLEKGDETNFVKFVGKKVDLINNTITTDYIRIPDGVSSAHAKIALYNISPGLLEQFNTYIKRTKNVPLKIYFTESTHWIRKSEYVEQLAKGIGWDEVTIDNIFIEGAKLINT